LVTPALNIHIIGAFIMNDCAVMRNGNCAVEESGTLDFAGVGGQLDGIVSPQGFELECTALDADDELHLWLRARDHQGRRYQGVIAADGSGLADGAKGLAAEFGMDARSAENQLALIITEQRKAWQAAKAQAQVAAPGFTGGIIDSKTLASTDKKLDWLVKKLLVRDQLAIIGGAKKALKTSIAIDLAISLGSGTRFLDKFDVPERVKVLVLSGESGEATIKETAKRRSTNWLALCTRSASATRDARCSSTCTLRLARTMRCC
jgi:hypothetical protein